MTFRTAALIALALLLTSCTSAGVLDGVPTLRTSTSTSTSTAVRPAASAFPALAGATDAEDQMLPAVAEDHGVLVAAGSTHSSGVWRPLILTSRDDGRSWGRVPLAVEPGATVDDRITSLVARGGRFYALGDASGGAASWTSADARTWTRHAIDAAAMGPDDDIAAMIATSAGFVAVGTRSTAGAFEAPEAWTSTDAVHWTAHQGTSAGLAGSAAGDTWLSDVTAGRAGLVAVGGHSFGHDDRQGVRVWRSSNGIVWRPVALPEDFGGTGTRSWLTTVWWSGAEYVAVGAGGSGANQRYAGLFATSSDGISWSAHSSGRGLVTSQEVYLTSGATWHGHAVALGEQCAQSCALYGLTDSASGWQSVRLPRGAGAGPGIGDTIVTSRGTILAVGVVNPREDQDAAIWRSTDGRSFMQVGVRPSVDTQRTVYVSDLAEARGRYLAVGSSGGLPVVWRSGDGRHFGAPAALSSDRAVSASVIEHGPSGWLVLGSRSTGNVQEGVVWASADGVRWRRSARSAFGGIGPYQYHDLSAATSWRGWVVVGDRSDDGANAQGALVAHSTNGQVWTPATNSGHQRRVGNRTVLRYDLQGDRDGTRAMNDVSAVGRGLLAVGWSHPSRGASSYRATIWRSADARIWTIDDLPEIGLGSSSAEAVVASGRTVLVYGTIEREDITLGVVWSSLDAGRTWRSHLLPGDGGRHVDVGADVLLSTSRGFVAGGRVGRAGAGRVALWTSPTGAVWSRVALTDPRLRASGDWGVNAVVAGPDRLIGVATHVDASGSHPIVFTQPIG